MNDPRYFSYVLPLRSGALRRGVLVRMPNRWGDAAPLDGWSSESFEDVVEWIRRGTDPAGAPASMRCALETSDWPVLHEKIPVNALLTGTAEEILAQSHSALSAGCECLKIKTAELSFAAIPPLLERILAIAPCRFRLDSNRAWSLGETLQLAEEVSGFPIEYFEEPIADPLEIPELIDESEIPVALDETLREISPDDLADFEGAAALVLKPTLFGGFEICRKFAEAGSALGMSSVVSAAFESGVGIHALGRFAASLEKISAAGLDTYSRLQSDILRQRLEFPGFHFQATEPLPEVDESKLQPV
ncbi:MAG: enolase C-terminal domain-like protein [Verrucomicrobiota bacterium]